MNYLQVNPTAESRNVSRELLEALDDLAEDFTIRYCFIPANSADEAISRLSNLPAQSGEDRSVIGEIVRLLKSGNEVELLYG